MNLFARKNKRNSEAENSKDKYEDRAPNHWTYNDDPLLNMEPVFTDDPEANKISIEDISRQYASGGSSVESESVSDKLAQIRKKLGTPSSSKPSGGILGSIIDGARKKTNDIQNEILENDPVIAKLQKIEELRKSGGVDADLYTDVNKVKSQSVSYAQRAKDFHEKNATKPVETEIERVRRLSQEVQNQRDERNRQRQLEIQQKTLDEEEEKKENIFLAVSKTQAQKKSKEEEVKSKLLELKEVKLKNLEEEVENTIQEIDSKVFFSDVMKEEFLDQKLKEFDKLLKDSKKQDRKPELIRPRRTQTKKK
ncbi:hypothetical protein [Spiroplasma monobiae]|uniref:Uncharacterized protein n=1 Tax=Spiroplasma monobiae MQ-1 TaxID=1336748 RepID=A0A2K9LX61_SPISQ|nr:hypothetical protein [Spiroplasma monobiae]AUM62945.1 hypothetical protein SMONO_v1c06960 [Spiroplasma monobiae MQ-1]